MAKRKRGALGMLKDINAGMKEARKVIRQARGLKKEAEEFAVEIGETVDTIKRATKAPEPESTGPADSRRAEADDDVAYSYGFVPVGGSRPKARPIPAQPQPKARPVQPEHQKIKDYKQAARVLGIPEDAGVDAIKARYHALAKVSHPDVGGNNSRMAQINEAYRVMTKHALRKQYEGG